MKLIFAAAMTSVLQLKNRYKILKNSMKKKHFILLFIFFFTSIIITGCFGTRQISLDDKAIKRKKEIIMHQSDLAYKLTNFTTWHKVGHAII